MLFATLGKVIILDNMTYLKIGLLDQITNKTPRAWIITTATRESNPRCDIFPRDKSGLQIVLNEDENIEVVFVAPDTPADDAGFQKGDSIKSINSIDTEYLGGLLAIRDLLRKEAGTKYTFTVSRDGETKDLTLKLRNLY